MKRMMLILAMSALPLAACSGKQTPGEAAASVEYPEWVLRGGGAYGGEKDVLYGVGASAGVKNPSLARSRADNRARADVQKVMQTYTASLMKDYAASTATGDLNNSSEEQHVEEAVKTFSAGTLSGVMIVDHWVNPQDNTLYSLARLDLAGFADQLDKAKELSQKVKERVKRAAAKAFADLEAEEAKHAE